MSLPLRIFLIAAVLFTFLYIFNRVRKNDMSVADTVFWIFFSVVLLLFAIFPQIAYFLADLFGFMAPINLILVFIIAVLVLKIFSMSIQISKLNKNISRFSQNMGLRQMDSDKKNSKEE